MTAPLALEEDWDLIDPNPAHTELQPWMIGRLLEVRVHGKRRGQRSESPGIVTVDRVHAGRLESYGRKRVTFEDGAQLGWADLGGFGSEKLDTVTLEIRVAHALADPKFSPAVRETPVRSTTRVIVMGDSRRTRAARNVKRMRHGR